MNTWVICIFKNKEGNLVDAKSIVIDNVGPNQTLPFEILLSGMAASEYFDIVAYPTRLEQLD